MKYEISLKDVTNEGITPLTGSDTNKSFYLDTKVIDVEDGDLDTLRKKLVAAGVPDHFLEKKQMGGYVGGLLHRGFSHRYVDQRDGEASERLLCYILKQVE